MPAYPPPVINLAPPGTPAAGRPASTLVAASSH
jgi:hypothetical protein